MFDLLGFVYRAEDHSVSSHVLLRMFEETRASKSERRSDSINCRPVFITIAYSAFWLFNKVAMEVRSAADFARKRALK